MNYKVRKTKRKTLAISIVDGEVIVRAPYFLNDKFIHEFVISKKEWIEKKLNAYRPVGIDLTKDTIRVFGKDILLRVSEGSTFSVSLDDELHVVCPRKISEKRCIEKIEIFLKEQLMNILMTSIEIYAAKLKIKTPPFKIRRYKRIHGRCNSKGELAFNLYLFHESVDFIRYVALHECAHILEFNHSQRFYRIIEEQMPNYKEIIALQKRQ